MIEILTVIISIMLLCSSVMVVISNTSIYAALFLIASYILVSCILLILKCEFIALIFITIYVGAVAVLFLFVILLLDTKFYNNKTSNILLYSYSYSFLLVLTFFIQILLLLLKNFHKNVYLYNTWLTNTHQNLILKADLLSDIEVLGQIISINFFVQLLIAGLILFLGVIGSVILSLNFAVKKTKLQTFYKQFSKDIKKSLIS